MQPTKFDEVGMTRLLQEILRPAPENHFRGLQKRYVASKVEEMAAEYYRHHPVSNETLPTRRTDDGC